MAEYFAFDLPTTDIDEYLYMLELRASLGDVSIGLAMTGTRVRLKKATAWTRAQEDAAQAVGLRAKSRSGESLALQKLDRENPLRDTTIDVLLETINDLRSRLGLQPVTLDTAKASIRDKLLDRLPAVRRIKEFFANLEGGNRGI